MPLAREMAVARAVTISATLVLVPMSSAAADAEGAAIAGHHRAPEDGGPRRWRVTGDDPATLRETPSDDAPTLGTLAPGEVLSNHGCRTTRGRVWCEVRPFAGGTGGHVPAARLSPARGPDGTVPHGLDDSPRRAAKGDFDERATIPCAQVRRQAMGTCTAGVARGGGGDATVVVTFSNGFRRTLGFAHGAFLRANVTMSGVGTDVDWRLDGERYVLRVDDQRFELPERLILGETG